MRWDVVTKPRVAGGLGISQAQLANIAFLGKLCWELTCPSRKLWATLLKEKYGCDEEGSNFQLRSNGSPTWNAMV